jgi:hypothetical protein
MEALYQRALLLVAIIKAFLLVQGLVESLGVWGGLTSLIRVLPSDMGLLDTLVRATMDLGSATCPGSCEPQVLLWLILILSFLLALPDTWSLSDEACLWNSYLLSIPGLADTVSFPR